MEPTRRKKTGKRKSEIGYHPATESPFAKVNAGKGGTVIPRENSDEKVKVSSKRDMTEEQLADYLHPDGDYAKRLSRKFASKAKKQKVMAKKMPVNIWVN